MTGYRLSAGLLVLQLVSAILGCQSQDSGWVYRERSPKKKINRMLTTVSQEKSNSGNNNKYDKREFCPKI